MPVARLFLVASVLVIAAAACGGGRSLTTAARSAAAPGCTFRAGGVLPDPKCTPGATNHAVTQRTIRTTICKPGWASSVRPPLYAGLRLKAAAMKEYGVTDYHSIESDHLIPIELGGAPADLRNIWPESHATSYQKDRAENLLNARVCHGTMTLRAARKLIRTDWRQALG